MNGGRKTALALVLAILAFELLANKQIQGAWAAMWGPTVPLGQGFQPSTTGGSGGGSNQVAPPGTVPKTGILQQ